MGKPLRLYLPAMLLIGTVAACGSATDGAKDGSKPGTGLSSEQAEKEQFPNETTSQRKARHKAEEYLAGSAQSRAGLIKQLESDKFSNQDATYAADALGVDWRDQAAQKAKEYVADSPQSRDGVKEQLLLDGFTEDEAEYGVSQFFDAVESP